MWLLLFENNVVYIFCKYFGIFWNAVIGESDLVLRWLIQNQKKLLHSNPKVQIARLQGPTLLQSWWYASKSRID